jgi:transcriptional antiterminator NusG
VVRVMATMVTDTANSNALVESRLTPQPERRWYALQTRSRFEKKVFQALHERQIEAFLPMRDILSCWKDRNKRVAMPLFPGYLFVRSQDVQSGRREILKVPGAVRLIGSNVSADAIPDEQILAVRRLVAASAVSDPCPYVQAGQPVEIIAGPFQGTRGMLVASKGRLRFLVQVDLIRQAVSIEIEAEHVRAL